MMGKVTVIGAGLAGCEAARRLIEHKIPVRLVEIRPKTSSPAYRSENFAEPMYSDSLRLDFLNNMIGILKEGMRHLGSIIVESAKTTRVPVGSTLVVDCQTFSRRITEQLKQHPLIKVVREEVTQIPDDPCVIANGPLTSDALNKAIQEYTHADYFHFYDAAAPVIERNSIDFSKAYIKSRYDKGEVTYINCAMSRREFDAFYEELIHTETAQLHEFEGKTYLGGCMPLEEMAHRGQQILLLGPMKPAGLERPDGTTPYAVVQLRQNSAVASLYNIAGFQTHLKRGGQKHLLSMIPGLKNVSIVRYGTVHRNSYLCAPKVLRPTYRHVQRDDLLFTGQLCGVEGYVESATSRLLAGMNMANPIREKVVVELPNTYVIGSMTHYITHVSERYFQPMNTNFRIMRLLEKAKKRERGETFANQTLSVVDTYKKELD